MNALDECIVGQGLFENVADSQLFREAAQLLVGAASDQDYRQKDLPAFSASTNCSPSIPGMR